MVDPYLFFQANNANTNTNYTIIGQAEIKQFKN
jgi:hypothetical protein